ADRGPARIDCGGAFHAGIQLPGVRGLRRSHRDLPDVEFNRCLGDAGPRAKACSPRPPRPCRPGGAEVSVSFDFDVIVRSAPYLFAEGMRFTVTLTALAALGGALLGTLLALMRLSPIRLLSWPAALYVNVMRSIPLLLVIFWLYFL